MFLMLPFVIFTVSGWASRHSFSLPQPQCSPSLVFRLFLRQTLLFSSLLFDSSSPLSDYLSHKSTISRIYHHLLISPPPPPPPPPWLASPALATNTSACQSPSHRSEDFRLLGGEVGCVQTTNSWKIKYDLFVDFQPSL